MANKFFGHLKTILTHKHLVFRYCRKSGLFRQGLFHDMSKFSPIEFIPGVRYFQGNRSPNDMQRRKEGYSAAWLNHKGRNRHHLEYWIDYNPEEEGKYAGLEMPLPYVVESVCDRIAASRIYNGDAYQNNFPLEYYRWTRSHILVHPATDQKFLFYLNYLAQNGEDALFKLMREDLAQYKKAKKESLRGTLN
jgi:hypothetical protein